MKPDDITEGWAVVPVDVCAVCDEGRDPLDVPSESCGHDRIYHRSVGVPVVPVATLADRDRRAREDERERILTRIAEVLPAPGIGPEHNEARDVLRVVLAAIREGGQHDE